MKAVSFKLPDRLHVLLARVSRRRNVAKSEIVRLALEDYFAKAPRADEPSCADLAGDLIGCLQGPRDLASNSKHFKGYGQ